VKNGSNKYFNPEFEARNAAIEAEMERVRNDQQHFSGKKIDLKIERTDDFYSLMSDFYEVETTKRHVSPTKRLMAHKKATWEHKEKIYTDIRNKQAYKLHYTSSPTKSYVIEPKGGEINYDLAYKNPVKFYDQVMKQEITQHKVQKNKASNKKNAPLTITTKVTTRKIGRILYAVQSKLTEMLQ
jgi:hypothetical protein